MTIGLDAIEAAARGATPGEWKSERRTSAEYYINTGPEPRLYIHSWQGMASVYGQEDDDEEVSNAVASANAHHIATMDPPTTLALVERVRKLEAIEAKARALVSAPRRTVRMNVAFAELREALEANA